MGSRRSLVLALLLASCDWGVPADLTGEQEREVERNLLDSVPIPAYPVGADLGGEVTYLGLDASPVPVVPGARLVLVHYFRVADIVFDWDVFVHLVHGGRSRLVNADHVPVGGLYPAWRWKKGQIVRDEQVVTLPADVEGSLKVYVGLFRGRERIEIRSGPGDRLSRVLAATLPVGEP
jgi:hypothetical protein